MNQIKTTSFDFSLSPLLVFYEITRACDLVCRHCRACAQSRRHPKELTEQQSRQLIAQLTEFPTPPLLVLTGGDPFKRSDVFDLVHKAKEHDLPVALTPSATPLVTDTALREVKAAGLHRLALSLDGAESATHDAFRGFSGSFDRTFEILEQAREIGIPVQINTTISRRNVHELDALADRLAAEQVVLWSVFFLIPVGRGRAEQRLDAAACEAVFQKLWHHAQHQPYAIKTTEAPHYRRFALQQDDHQNADSSKPSDKAPPMAGVRDGQGVMFVSHTGQVFPSGFLPIECGRFPRDSIVEVYQNDPLFCRLRDHDQLKGKCGVCEYRQVCGGSRARAYAVTRDPMAAEPDCAFLPPHWRKSTLDSPQAKHSGIRIH